MTLQFLREKLDAPTDRITPSLALSLHRFSIRMCRMVKSPWQRFTSDDDLLIEREFSDNYANHNPRMQRILKTYHDHSIEAKRQMRIYEIENKERNRLKDIETKERGDRIFGHLFRD